MEKELLIQFFHERTYSPQPLEEFEREAERAAKLGARYVYIGEIPKDHQDWDEHPGDPYPNWGMLLTSLFKIVVPDRLKNVLNTERAKKNFELLRQRADILKKYHLRAALTLSEPFYLPERVYREHPAWRGPRCDHPRRSKEMYFSPCIDEPEVLALYAEAMDRLCREIDIGYLQLITNDSGAGVCWSSGLYNGPNGPQACRHIPLEKRLLTFMRVFQEAARKNGREMITDITSHIIGFKTADLAMDGVWKQLEPGQIVNRRDCHGEVPIEHVSFGLYEHFRPLRRIPVPLDFLNLLDSAMRAPCYAVDIQIRECEFDEYDRVIAAYAERQPKNSAEKMMLLLKVAGEIAGEKHAEQLLEAWVEIGRALQELREIWLDNFVMMPLVSQRLINRPFVPKPERLTEEEMAYYRPFIFQATNEKQAQDLMNIQGMDFIRGFSGTRMAVLSMREAEKHLKNALTYIDSMDDIKFDELARRVKVMLCLVETMIHACRYQEILDRTREDEQPAYQTRWPVEGDERMIQLGEIARAEIDNCYRLYDLISGYEQELFALTDDPKNEDIFMMTTYLPKQLLRKAEIMINHMRDADDIYETNNK